VNFVKICDISVSELTDISCLKAIDYLVYMDYGLAI